MSRLNESVAEFSAQLPAPGKLGEQRAAAARAFALAGLPKVTEERWRYTDISKLAESELRLAPAAEAQGLSSEYLPLQCSRLVFVNGRLDETQAQLNAVFSSTVSVLGTDWNALADGFPRFADIVEYPLGQLNTAAAQHGVLIRTAGAAPVDRAADAQSGEHGDELLHIVLAQTGAAPLALQPRIVIDLAANSSVRVVVQYVSDCPAASWTNAVIEIQQAAGSQLELLQLQEHGPNHTHTALISAALERDASASIASFDLGASLARNDIDVSLRGRGSRADVFGAFLPVEAQHIDTHVCIDHVSADTQSSTWFRGIAGERSRGVFNGKVIVRPDAQRISAEQRSDNLLLVQGAEIDTKPELEIYADDVRCSHGATVGELDEQHLFYLRSRGIDEAAARALLTYAFARTAVEHIRDDTLRELIATRIAARLPEHERWERLD